MAQHGTAEGRTTTRSKTAAECNATTVRNSLFAGYMAGVCGTLIGHPLDSAKVWMQTGKRSLPTSTITIITHRPAPPGVASQPQIRHSSSLASGVSQHANLFSMRQAARTVQALYAGVSGPLVTVGLVQSIHFAIYDSIRRTLYYQGSSNDKSKSYLHNDKISHVALASMTSGAVLACVTNPLLLIKVRQQTTAHGLSYRQALRETWSGSPLQTLRTLYTGFTPHAVTEIAGRAVYFVVYESLKRQYEQGKMTIPERMGAAALSGVICWSVIFPLDAIRCRMFASSASRSFRESTPSCWRMARTIYAEHGLRSFYRGFSVTFVRAGPVAAIVLPVYDLTLEVLSR